MTTIKFGTDGVRGIAGVDITPEMIYKTTVATAEELAWWGGLAVVGHDPRNSSPTLASAACEGFADSGMDVFFVGMTTTPGIAYLTKYARAQAGVVISASHNPKEQNGIKLLGPEGAKVSDEVEARIASLANRGSKPIGPRGRVFQRANMIHAYEQHLLDTADVSLNGLTVVMDPAHGAAGGLGPKIYEKLGAKVLTIFGEPNGDFINEGCGATHTASLRHHLVESGADLGIAYDGDADRTLLASAGMLDELPMAREVDGDDMMYIVARQLGINGLVTTIMTNSGIELALKGYGIAMERADVGDRYVAERMRATGFHLGGEASGHIIDWMRSPRTGNKPYLSMGDGIHTSLLVLRSILASGRNLEEWHQEVTACRFPLKLTSIPVCDKQYVDEDPEFRAIVAAANSELGPHGRVVSRPSGTEPKYRILVEAEDPDTAEKLSKDLSELVQRRFGTRN